MEREWVGEMKREEEGKRVRKKEREFVRAM